jgi:hypothetical protein
MDDSVMLKTFFLFYISSSKLPVKLCYLSVPVWSNNVCLECEKRKGTPGYSKPGTVSSTHKKVAIALGCFSDV